MKKKNKKRDSFNQLLIGFVILGVMMFFLAISASFAYAATYYVPDDFSTLSAACSGISGGDTVIVRDGTYTGTANAVSGVPSGSSGSYTTIRAENDFGAILDGTGSGWTNPVDLSGKSYIIFQGFRIRNSSSYEAGIYADNSDHIKLMKLSLNNAVGYQNSECKYACPIKMRDVTYSLIEECFVSGRMRYGILIRNEYNSGGKSCAYNIIRRCVVRWDYYAQRDGGQPMAGISTYGTDADSTIHDILIQNCIVLDWNPGNYGSKNSIYGGFYTPHTTKNITYQGCIALNIHGTMSLTNYDQILSGFMIADDKSNNGNRAMYNCTAWDTEGPGVWIERGDSMVTTLDQITVGDADSNHREIRNSVYDKSGGTSNMSNSLIVSNPYSDNIDNSTYNWYYPANQARGSNYITTNPSLQYITRTTDSGTGQSGKKRGATIEKRYGVSGTVWGETGYDQLTDEDLWPFPHEDVIYDDFRQSNPIPSDSSANFIPSSNNPQRGFCANGQTLTKYVWEYLGNTIPAEIYSGGVLRVSTSSLADATVNVSYSKTLSGASGTVPYTWAVIAGSLPNGLSLNGSSGVISGTPTQSGTSNFTIRITDNNSDTATKDLSITVNAPDTTSPVISNISSSSITDETATITWATNEAATSRVEYGTTASYGSQTTLDSTLETSHSVDLSGLSSNTTYHYRVKSKDAADNERISADSFFSTANYSTYTSTDSTLVLEGSTPEEGTMTVSIGTNPANATSAELVLTILDPDNDNEGYIYINGNSAIELPWDSGYDGQVVELDPISFSKDWLVQGTNSIRFTHETTAGYQVQSLAIRLSFSGASDTTAPAAVSNLNAVTGSSNGQIDLSWTAPGDDGSSGTAAGYTIKYAAFAITNDSQFNNAVNVTGEPGPSAAGSAESMTISGLTPGTTYHFAMKTQDDAANTSSLSNSDSAEAKQTVVSDTTPPYTTGHSPSKNAINVQPDTNIIVHVKDDGVGVDINTIVMRVNGQIVSPTITGTSADYTLTYNPNQDFSTGTVVSVTVDAEDLAP